MRPGKRFGLSAVQKSELLRRWKAGQTLHEIGRALDKGPSSIRCVVSLHGGIVPAVRRRSLLALTLPEREDISRGIASGAALRTIAQHLDRAVSTVSREVARHGGRCAYRANEADDQAWKSALRPKPCLLGLLNNATAAQSPFRREPDGPTHDRKRCRSFDSCMILLFKKSKLERKQGYQEEETCPVCRLPDMWTESAEQIVKY